MCEPSPKPVARLASGTSSRPWRDMSRASRRWPTSSVSITSASAPTSTSHPEASRITRNGCTSSWRCYAVTSPPKRILCRILACSFVLTASAYGGEDTPLDRYVAAFDPHYHYALLNTTATDTYTAYVLEMTSQQWRAAEEVDRPLWKHWLTIVRPQHLTTSTGFLIVSGGSNEKPSPAINPVLTQLALSSNSVISEVRMVPNE